jgi:hypothetical protein
MRLRSMIAVMQSIAITVIAHVGQWREKKEAHPLRWVGFVGFD